MRRSYPIALGGVLAALAVTIMSLGTMIPLATYVCPLLCSVILVFVFRICGKKIAWVWYTAVALLGVLLSPDKEAAAVFVALGYYPIIKPMLDKSRLKWVWKLLFFNLVTAILYSVLLYVFGMHYIASEFRELGLIGLVVTLILGNVSFLLLDRALWMVQLKFLK